MFKKGQKVWDAMFGPGVVLEIPTNGAMFPVVVRFGEGLVDYFTLDGKYRPYVLRTLFPYPVEIVKAATKPSIDWSHVSSEYNYLVQDSDGESYLCSDKPSRTESGWDTESSYTVADAHGLASYVKGICDWKESLIKRPD